MIALSWLMAPPDDPTRKASSGAGAKGPAGPATSSWDARNVAHENADRLTAAAPPPPHQDHRHARPGEFHARGASRRLFQAGADVFRLNFSHGSA